MVMAKSGGMRRKGFIGNLHFAPVEGLRGSEARK